RRLYRFRARCRTFLGSHRRYARPVRAIPPGRRRTAEDGCQFMSATLTTLTESHDDANPASMPEDRIRGPGGRLQAVAPRGHRRPALIGQLWYILKRRERIEGAFLLCGMALSALFEAVGIGLVAPFIAILKDPGLVLNAPMAQPVLSALDIHEP